MKQIVEHARDGESHETLLPDNMKPFGEIGNTEAVVVEEADPLFSKAISLDVDEDTGDKTLTMLGKIQCRNSKSRGEDSFSVGFNTVAENDQELAAGRYNFSHKGSESWGDPGNTIHSIGIGTEESNRTNAVEVMQDGKVYVIGAGGYDGKTLEGASDLATILNGIPEQLADYVKLEDLQDGITFDNLNANSLTVDGKDVSLVGHKHVVSDIEDLNGLWSIPGAEAAATNAIQMIEDAQNMNEVKNAMIEFLRNFKRPTE